MPYRVEYQSIQHTNKVGLHDDRVHNGDAGALLGLKTERYGAYERGDGEPPSEVLATLRRVTGVSLDKLIGIGNAVTNGRSYSLMLAMPVGPPPKL